MFEDQVNQFVSRCPLCNAVYRMEDASTVDSMDDASMMYVECARCKSAIVSVIAMSGMGMISFGMVTDMTRDDLERFRAATSMSSDELLEMIQLLQRRDRTVVRELVRVHEREERG